MKLTGNINGLHLRSERANGDGSVTSEWTDSQGRGFGYAGSRGATLVVGTSTAVDHGKRVTTYRVGVELPAIAKTSAALKAAEAAYSHQSPYTDLLRLGVSPAVAQKEAGHSASREAATPQSVQGGGTPYEGGCAADISYEGGARGCVTRDIVVQYGSDWWLTDDLIGFANNGNVGGLFLTPDLRIEMWYGPHNVVTDWTPAQGGGTGCQVVDKTYNISAGLPGGITPGLSATTHDQYCSGYTYLLNQSGLFGIHWDGRSNGNVAIEAVGTVHSPPSASINNSVLELQWGFPGVNQPSSTCHAPFVNQPGCG